MPFILGSFTLRLMDIVDAFITGSIGDGVTDIPFSGASVFEATVVAHVDPTGPAGGDNEGTVDTEEPGEVELEFSLRCKCCT